jgi:hypothetical protein
MHAVAVLSKINNSYSPDMKLGRTQNRSDGEEKIPIPLAEI